MIDNDLRIRRRIACRKASLLLEHAIDTNQAVTAGMAAAVEGRRGGVTVGRQHDFGLKG
jgi:hypothetical protein